jgi:hypothetical protein
VWVAVVVAALALLVTSCGGGSSSPPTAAGHGSPAEAAAGFVKGINDKDPNEACGYLTPSLQSECTSLFSKPEAAIDLELRDFKVVSSKQSGDSATVTVKLSACPATAAGRSPTCTLLSGGPSGTPGASSKSTESVKATRVNGQWYID